MLAKFHVRGNLTLKIATLAQTWSQLGLMLGGFWVPSWSQVGTEWHQNTTQQTIKKNCSWKASRSIFVDFWVQLGGSRVVAQNQVLELFLAFGAFLRPRWPQEPPKRPQDTLQDRCVEPFWMIFLDFLMHFN